MARKNADDAGQREVRSRRGFTVRSPHFRPGSTDSGSKPCAHEPKCPCLRLRSIPVLKEVCSGLPSEEVAADAKTTES